jgi:hypothetical protein
VFFACVDFNNSLEALLDARRLENRLDAGWYERRVDDATIPPEILLPTADGGK